MDKPDRVQLDGGLAQIREAVGAIEQLLNSHPQLQDTAVRLPLVAATGLAWSGLMADARTRRLQDR
jgi:hypothetical protein